MLSLSVRVSSKALLPLAVRFTPGTLKVCSPVSCPDIVKGDGPLTVGEEKSASF